MFVVLVLLRESGMGEFDLDTLGLHGEHMAFWDCMGFSD
jgi:hypothetical protein